MSTCRWPNVDASLYDMFELLVREYYYNVAPDFLYGLNPLPDPVLLNAFGGDHFVIDSGVRLTGQGEKHVDLERSVIFEARIGM